MSMEHYHAAGFEGQVPLTGPVNQYGTDISGSAHYFTMAGYVIFFLLILGKFCKLEGVMRC